MRKFDRKAGFVGLGAAVALAILLSAYAAANAGGQGVNVVEGYSASEFGFQTSADENTDDDSGSVTLVEFLLKKSQDGDGVSTISGADTKVFVQLMGRVDQENADWAGCTVGFNEKTRQQGWVTCEIFGASQKTLSEIDAVNIVAYDNDSSQ